MKVRRIRFLGPGQCVLETTDEEDVSLRPSQFRLKTDYSVVSVGTELANFLGVEPGVSVPGGWSAYPSTPGYGAVGRVLAVGGDMPGMPAVGERVFAFNPHASVSVGDVSSHFVVPLADTDDGALMTLIRMAGVSITVLRRAKTVQPGAVAAVIGLGAVGNFAAQLLQRAGLEVHNFDPDPARVEVARQVGLRLVTEEAVRADFSSAWRDGHGGGADIVVEATGLSALAGAATSLARYGGEVLLLGSPRAPHRSDTTDLLRDIQLRGLTVIGASEWTAPRKGHRHLATDSWTIEDNYRYLHSALSAGQLVAGPLLSRLASPTEAPDLYKELATGGSGMVSAVLDWRG